MIQGRTVDAKEFSHFLQDKVWLHLVGTSTLHYAILDEKDDLKKVRERPELYAPSEVHLVASMVDAVNGGI